MSKKFQKSFLCFCFIFIMSVSTSLSATPDESSSNAFDSTINFRLHASGQYITFNELPFISPFGRLTLANSTGDELMVVACVNGGADMVVGIISDAESLDITDFLDTRSGLFDLEIKILPVRLNALQAFSFYFVS